MQKDYYKILQVPPHATIAEIKKAYRRLAMAYHPDKNREDPFAAAHFSDVREAYEILINPAKKEAYLQDRWYHQSLGKKRTAETITPVSILKLSLELERHVSTLDIHRTNKEGLSNYIMELLSPDTIEKLKVFNDKEINQQVIVTLLAAMKPFSLKDIRPLLQRLETLAGDDEESLQRIGNFLLLHKKNFLWDKYRLAMMLLFTLLICLLIYFMSK